jgi:hypothetical protein
MDEEQYMVDASVKSSLQQLLTAIQSEVLNTILSTPHLNKVSGMLDSLLEALFVQGNFMKIY